MLDGSLGALTSDPSVWLLGVRFNRFQPARFCRRPPRSPHKHMVVRLATSSTSTGPVKEIIAMASPSTLDLLRDYNRRFIFPLEFCAGIVGNALNLVVLNSAQMRTKTNLFLSALAVADLCFFIAALPLNLFIYGSPRANGTKANGTRLEPVEPFQDYFDAFLARTYIPSMVLVNWFSASSIW